MKLPTSNKTASYGKKPYVKKGYYPAQLLSVKPYANKEGTLIEGTYGHQLIFEFAIFAKDEKDTPTSPMMFEEEGKEPVPVKIPKFVYHQYKDKENPGEFQTAITPNSAITKLLQALGWKFSENDVDIEPLLGNWAEVNVNDFPTKTKEGEAYTSSSIADVGPYNGGEVPTDLQAVPASKKPESVSKQVKHSDVKTESEVPKDKEDSKTEGIPKADIADDESPEKLKSRIEELNKLHKDGFISDDGHKQAVEQLQSKIDSLNK